MKNIRFFFYLKMFHFSVVKFSVYLYRLVFVMMNMTLLMKYTENVHAERKTTCCRNHFKIADNSSKCQILHKIGQNGLVLTKINFCICSLFGNLI